MSPNKSSRTLCPSDEASFGWSIPCVRCVPLMMRAKPKYPGPGLHTGGGLPQELLAETLYSSGPHSKMPSLRPPLSSRPDLSQHNVMLPPCQGWSHRLVQGTRRAEGRIYQGTERPRPFVLGQIGRGRIDIAPLKPAATSSFEWRPFLCTISLLSLFSPSLNPSFYSKTSSHKLTL